MIWKLTGVSQSKSEWTSLSPSFPSPHLFLFYIITRNPQRWKNFKVSSWYICGKTKHVSSQKCCFPDQFKRVLGLFYTWNTMCNADMLHCSYGNEMKNPWVLPYLLDQRSAIFFAVKFHVVRILDFAGNRVSVATSQLCCCTKKAIVENT